MNGMQPVAAAILGKPKKYPFPSILGVGII